MAIIDNRFKSKTIVDRRPQASKIVDRRAEAQPKATAGSIVAAFGGSLANTAFLGLPEAGVRAKMESVKGKEFTDKFFRESQDTLPEKLAGLAGTGAGFLVGGPAKWLAKKGLQVGGKVASAIVPKLAMKNPFAIKAATYGVQGGVGNMAYDLLSIDGEEAADPSKLFNPSEQVKKAISAGAIGAGIGSVAGIGAQAIGPKIEKWAAKSGIKIGPTAAPIRGTKELDDVADMIERNNIAHAQKVVDARKEAILKIEDDLRPVVWFDEAVSNILGRRLKFDEESHPWIKSMVGSTLKNAMWARDNIKPHVDSVKDMEGIFNEYLIFKRAREIADRPAYQWVEATAEALSKNKGATVYSMGNQGKKYIAEPVKDRLFRDITVEKADDAIAKIEASLSPQDLARMKAAEEGIYNAMRSIAFKQYKAGIWSSKDLYNILAKNKNYTPWHVLQGHRQALKDGVRVNTFEAAEQYYMNKVKGNPDKDIVNPLDEVYQYAMGAGLNAERNMFFRKVIDTNNLLPVDKRIFNLTESKGKHGFDVWEDGVKKTYYTNDDDLATALAGADRQQMDIVTKWAAAPTRWLREAATAAPSFLMRSPARDIRQMLMIGDPRLGINELNVIPVWLKGFWVAATRGIKGSEGNRLFREYVNNYGAMSGLHESQAAMDIIRGTAISDKAPVLGKTWQIVRELANTTELATRLGVMRQGIKQGLSAREATWIARKTGLDFNQAGSYTRVLNNWIPFLNPRIQGTVANIQAASSKDPATRNKWWRTAITTIGVPTAYTMYHNLEQYPDVWFSISPSDKRENFIIIKGDGRDERGRFNQVIKIPKGDAGRILAAPIETSIEFAYRNKEKDPTAYMLMKKNLGEGFIQGISDVSPISFATEGKVDPRAIAGLAPPVLKAASESAFNMNTFTGQPITPKRFEDAPTPERYDIRTSPVAVALSKSPLGRAMGWDGFTIDNTIGTMFGGLGRIVADPERIKDTINSNFTRAYAKGDDQVKSEILKDVKEITGAENAQRYRQVQAAFDTYKNMNKADKQAVYNYVVSQFTNDSKARKEFMTKVENDMKGYNNFDYDFKSLTTREKMLWIYEYADTMGMTEDEALALTIGFISRGDLTIEGLKRSAKEMRNK